MGGREVRMATDCLFKIGSAGSSRVVVELMLARYTPKGQLIDIKVARGRSQDGVLLDFPNAGMQSSCDSACDLMLHLRNVLRIG